MAAAAMVLLGWWLDHALLRSVLPGAVQMKANAALGLLAAGMALLLATGARTRWREPAVRGLALALVLLGAATLVQYVAGVNFGIDEVMFRDPVRTFAAAPGRMSPFTAWAFVLLGTCLLLLGRRGWQGWAVMLASLQIALIGLVALIGYLWNATELVTDSWAPPVALNTAMVLVAVAAGIVLEHLRAGHVRAEDPFSPIERKLVATFWVMVLMLMVTASFTFRSNVEFVQAAQRVAQTQHVRFKMARLSGCLDNVESAQRRYLLVGDAAARTGFLGMVASCRSTLDAVVALFPAGTQQHARALTLREAVPRRLQALESVAAIFEKQGIDAARGALAFQSGQQTMQRIELLLEEMDGVERSLLQAREATQARDRTLMQASLLLALLVSIGIFGLLIRGMRREVRAGNLLREEMRHQRALLRAVVDSIPDVMVYKDLQGRYLGCNEAFAAMTGKDPAQVHGCNAEDLFTAEYARLTRARDQHVLACSARTVVEDWMQRPDGARVLMEVVRTPLRDGNGVPIGLLAIGRDITQRKEAQDKMVRARELAEEAARTKAAFLANMSHEIRTPLTGMLGMVDLLSAEPLTPAQHGYVGAMRTSGRHLLSVINDILDFSRTETGELELEQIDFSVPDMLERLRSIAHPLAADRGLQLHFALTPHSPAVVRGDPTRLTQVLLNLVSNAVKFTERGSVTVTVSQSAGAGAAACHRFEVRDTGLGIAPDVLQRLFAPFVQADSSTVRRFGGSGLGLAISKRLVEAMGGTIGASSEPGAGSVFHFEIPLEPGDPDALQRPGKADAAPLQGRRILVAEDVALNRDILRVALGRQEHQLVMAQDGAQALALVQQQPFDLVLMDVQMPVMDGVEATRRIRCLDGPVRDIPIIGLTANVMAHERARYLAAGMNACVMKPIDWEALNAAIARCAPVPSDTTVATGLVDAGVLDALRGVLGDAQMRRLLREGMATFRGYCDGMAGGGMHDAAHKLKGSAGTLGLAGISAAAERVEAAIDQGGDGGPHLPALREALERTDRELAALGLLAP